MARLATRGLRLEAHKERSTAQPITAATVPQQLVLALNQQAGAANTPVVKVGDAVLLGQPIARPSSAHGAWLHSPVSGVVVAIEPRPVPPAQPDDQQTVSQCIVIDNDGRDQRCDFQAVDYQQLSPEELREHIAQGGIVGLGGAVFPTARKLASLANNSGTYLLVNGAECEPYISCDDMLMREHAADVVLGARILQRACGAEHCIIAVEDEMRDAIAAMNNALRATGDGQIHLAIVPTVYPAGGERQLINTVCGIEVPSGKLPTDVGVLCQNVGTAAATARWLRDGEPLISRIVTITGDGVLQPRNLRARIGTPLSTLIADCGGYSERQHKLIMGGSMMGLELAGDDLPLIKAGNCVLAASLLDLTPRGVEMPCIRCGNCSDVCPAHLLPQQLHWYVQPPDPAALDRHGLLDCIECGCCDYVCPSQIPLTSRFRAAKPALIEQRDDSQTRADTLRARFEARTQRLARLEAEHREKLAAKRRQLRDKS